MTSTELLAARDRAHGLLLSWLTPEQAEDFAATRSFVCMGNATGNLYRIMAGTIANIVPLASRFDRLCARIEELWSYTDDAWPGVETQSIPTFDHMLAQKIMIEGDEEEFLRVANRVTW